jgi:chorismate mutase
MSLNPPLSRSVAIVSTVAVLVLSGSSGAAAATGPAVPGAPATASAQITASAPATGDLRRTDSLAPLIDLAVQRILLADKVAAAKFGTGQPIEDPAREQQVLKEVTSLSTGMGLDPMVGTRFFRDQIEAGKIVQHGLYALWTTRPNLRPADRPDLTTEVRPQLDTITTKVLEQLKVTAGIRGATLDCGTRLSAAALSATLHHHLDALHRDALNVALDSICTAP